mmetsp:Transcript_21738/g.37329  ORF Transcript_21738/g.37329 Transcript_21738/m.37329 type:complete len:87 (-) Transcript_21738:284-544(-)
MRLEERPERVDRSSRGWDLSLGGADRGTCLYRDRDLSAEKTRLRRLVGEEAPEAAVVAGLREGSCCFALLTELYWDWGWVDELAGE